MRAVLGSLYVTGSLQEHADFGIRQTKLPVDVAASPAEADAALREAVVAVDASVLLDLYRFRPQTSRDLIETLRSLGDRLVVPHQALREFWRRRQRAHDSPAAATKVATDALDKSG